MQSGLTSLPPCIYFYYSLINSQQLNTLSTVTVLVPGAGRKVGENISSGAILGAEIGY